MKSYIDSVDDGYKSLITRFGKYDPTTEITIERFMIKLNNSTTFIDENDIAELIEQYSNECSFYLDRIEEMFQNEIEAFIWYIVMRLDILRGIFPGLNNGDPFNINSKLDKFENQMWKIINQYFDV